MRKIRSFVPPPPRPPPKLFISTEKWQTWMQWFFFDELLSSIKSKPSNFETIAFYLPPHWYQMFVYKILALISKNGGLSHFSAAEFVEFSNTKVDFFFYVVEREDVDNITLPIQIRPLLAELLNIPFRYGQSRCCGSIFGQCVMACRNQPMSDGTYCQNRRAGKRTSP